MNKYKYEIRIFWSEDDNCYLGSVTELLGCMADGSSYEECLSNLEVVIDEWIETAISLGRVIPSPQIKNLII